MHKNDQAGQMIASYIRHCGLKNIPILVFSAGAHGAHFVEKEWLMGSTTEENIVRKYIEGLHHPIAAPHAWAKHLAI